MQKKPFDYYLKWVAIVHIALLTIFLAFSGFQGCFKKKPKITIPVEFVVEVPQGKPDKVDAPPSVPDKKKPAKPVRKKIERSKKRVTRVPDGTPKKKFSKKDLEKIDKLLAEGAKPSDHTSIPDEDSRCFLLIKQALYDSWNQPSREEVGDSVAEVSITIGQGGVITARRVNRPSGNEKLDSSVLRAIESVSRVGGLTSAFIARHSVVTVSFKVE